MKLGHDFGIPMGSQIRPLHCICDPGLIVRGVPDSRCLTHGTATALVECQPGTFLERLIVEAAPEREEVSSTSETGC